MVAGDKIDDEGERGREVMRVGVCTLLLLRRDWEELVELCMDERSDARDGGGGGTRRGT